MEIWHRGTIGPVLAQKWADRGLKLKALKTPGSKETQFWEFEIKETDDKWSELKFDLDGAHTFITTRFNRKEMLASDWCILRATHSIASALDPAFSRSVHTFSEPIINGACRECGTGWTQVEDFRFKKEPNLGKHAFTGLGSGFELFVRNEVYEQLVAMGITGFAARRLLTGRGGKLPGLSQLVPKLMAKPCIDMERAESERFSKHHCEACDAEWCAHYVRGVLPLKRAGLAAGVDAQLTGDWFGNGRTARREILASSKLVEAILENGWSGVELIPVDVTE